MPAHIVAAIVIGITTAVQIDESNKQAKAIRNKGKVKANLSAAERVAAKRKSFREARVRRAQIVNEAAVEGATGSSGEIGALGSVQTQLGANLGAFNQGTQASKTLGGLNRDLSDSTGRSGIASGIGSIATSIFAAKSPKGSSGGVTTPEADLSGI